MVYVLAFISVALMTWVAWTYCARTLRDEIHPVPGSWIISTTTIFLSLWTYWNSPNHSALANIGNVGGTNVIVITAVILFHYHRQGRLGISFNSFQKKSLVAAGAIIVLWQASAPFIGMGLASVISNLATQVLMLISYTTIVEKLYRSGKNTEPINAWTGISVAAAISVAVALMTKNPLSIVYSIRWFLSALAILSLMLWIERRKDSLSLGRA